MGMWLLIHAGIKINLYYEMGPQGFISGGINIAILPVYSIMEMRWSCDHLISLLKHPTFFLNLKVKHALAKKKPPEVYCVQGVF